MARANQAHADATKGRDAQGDSACLSNLIPNPDMGIWRGRNSQRRPPRRDDESSHGALTTPPCYNQPSPIPLTPYPPPASPHTMVAPLSPRGSLEEDAPLLSPTTAESQAPTHAPQKKKKKKPWLVLAALIGLLIVIVDIGAFLMEPPKTRLFEANICLRYYEKNDPSKIGPDGTVDEALCKVEQVQQEMAMIFGWQDMFDSIPGLLLAVPYGALADKWGRKWVFAGCLQGLQFGTAWVLLIGKCAAKVAGGWRLRWLQAISRVFRCN